MLKLNRMTDYAILVLGILATRTDRYVSSSEVARLSNLEKPTIAKLIKQLAAAQIIVSQRGSQGGARFVKHLGLINLAEVIEAIEGPIALTACVEGSQEPCDVKNICFMSGNWNQVNQALYAALSSVTLEKLFDSAKLFPKADSLKSPGLDTMMFSSTAITEMELK
ncbi:SUF system Fe-S cluster assembly regulator [Alphaproteobacteria bacterium]|jgi:FeS assembly SUF system regulator|nr:SUF system Fe-S cluster assembly regulator [Alphaproteobacteria bacterium]MBT5799434.1 SUF system Fe-S cluster assembly regulator [Alphaproteobacteria bacterium]MDA9816353.1 SUF system Fe-S cluster assembly regulator [Alphaproteobacteria bacterium]